MVGRQGRRASLSSGVQVAAVLECYYKARGVERSPDQVVEEVDEVTTVPQVVSDLENMPLDSGCACMRRH